MPHSMTYREAREYFPRGLYQPEGSYRFAADSLLLASFLHCGPGKRILDIGTGCGVVALAVLFANPGIEAWGLEREPQLAAAARKNADRLGFRERLRIIEAAACADVFAHDAGRGRESPPEGGFSLVLANPPFRRPDRGKIPPSALRRNALFEEEHTLRDFCACAARALSPQGRFGILHDAARQDFLIEKLRAAAMAPLRILPIRTLPDRAPARILVEACLYRQGEELSCRTEEPLVLHNTDGTISAEAARFCPFLSG